MIIRRYGVVSHTGLLIVRSVSSLFLLNIGVASRSESVMLLSLSSPLHAIVIYQIQQRSVVIYERSLVG